MAITEQDAVVVTVAPRVPKPLSTKQRHKVRQMMGGDATVEQLQSLERAFAKGRRR